jgi:peptidoglycan L-alanyl-D-glutamate endopeptidase CwlK
MKFLTNKQFQLYAGGTLLGLTLILILRKMLKKDYSKYKWFNDARTKKYFNALHPKFKPLVAEFFTKVEENGMDVYVTSGYRSFAEQTKLHQQNPSNAKPGYSYHNFGLAIDINIMKNGTIILRKSDSCEKWKQSFVPKLAVDSGLRWMCKFGSYHDPVHFDYVPKGLNSTLLRERVLNGKVDSMGYVIF